MRAYIDANVLIWQLRGDKAAFKFFTHMRDAGEYELWTGALQRAEIVFFMRPEEQVATELLLSQFKTAAVDQKIVDSAGKLYRTWRPSHGLDMMDAILAATALETGGHVFTLNKKHFPMPEIIVKKAW